MDSLIAAAGRFLANGVPLGAQFVALRDDPAALVLRDLNGSPRPLAAAAAALDARGDHANALHARGLESDGADLF